MKPQITEHDRRPAITVEQDPGTLIIYRGGSDPFFALAWQPGKARGNADFYYQPLLLGYRSVKSARLYLRPAAALYRHLRRSGVLTGKGKQSFYNLAGVGV